MRAPKFTDAHRFPQPYADAKASSEPGYLAERFRVIRERQQKDAAEATDKARKLKERK